MIMTKAFNVLKYGNPYGDINDIPGKPNIATSEGTLAWKSKGEFHREDGPAIIWENGCEEWYYHGEYHRDNGPAIIDGDNYEWFINDVDLTVEIQEWMECYNITYPFSEEHLILFRLRWC